jgi:hypothetical protein
MAEKKARKARQPHAGIDRETPAYRVIYGVFGGLTPFCNATGVAIGTAHRWLRDGIIPAKRQQPIMLAARQLDLQLDPALFVDVPPEALAA